jgi:hypothetical protein
MAFLVRRVYTCSTPEEEEEYSEQRQLIRVCCQWLHALANDVSISLCVRVYLCVCVSTFAAIVRE